MERNYDEIIAEMLMSIDKHTEELNKSSKELTTQSQELTRHSQELTRHSQEFVAIRSEQNQIHTALLTRLEGMEKTSHQQLEQLVHSATILDRIIKRNDLRV